MRDLATAAALLLAACGAAPTQASNTEPDTVETRSANAPFDPARADQTRAPLTTADVAFTVETVARELEYPWGLEFLPDGRMIVTERAGRMRLIGPGGSMSEPLAGLPDVDVRGQGGLLDVALSPDFDEDRLIYWSYAQPRESGNATAVARGRLAEGAGAALTDVEVIWEQAPAMVSGQHYGSRLVFAADGTLFITTGERSIRDGRKQAQALDSTLGKIVRIAPDGEAPSDNPFVNRDGARPEIWSLGHRNIQGATIRPGTDQLWAIEHGPRGGDELNLIEAGQNYGWPTITYGLEYSGAEVGDGLTRAQGMEQPVYYWDPVIAPSGIAFYDSELFPAWRGSLFVAAMKPAHLARLTLSGDRVVGEERLLADLGERIRDVKVGPDGAIYVITDEIDGRILKLVPR